MEANESSATSSFASSFGSFDDVSVKPSGAVVKFLCSYGGRILPRYPDAKLRYIGGETRVLSVDRSVLFSDLLAKLGELCRWGSVRLRCRLPTEDLDALISVTSDEDLANLLEEYDLAATDRAAPLKVRAFLFPTSNPPKEPLPTPHLQSTSGGCCLHHVAAPARYPGQIERSYGDPRRRGRRPALTGYGSPTAQPFLVHHGNHWQ